MSQRQPTAPADIVELLLHQASLRPGRAAFIIHDEAGDQVALTLGQLLERSLRCAESLQQRGLRRGDRVLICLPTCPEILHTFYGVLLAGAVCVPVYPPLPGQGLDRWQARVGAIAQVAQPWGAVAPAGAQLHMAAVLEQAGPELVTVAPADLRGEQSAAPVRPQAEDLAFIQFTSGTTSRPRGVAVTHAALWANMQALVDVMDLREDDISVSWLPVYHDMGLVGHVFVPLQRAVCQHLLPPTAFARDPARWLRLVSEVRATQTTAPNFAFSICARRIPAARRAGLDLSSLRQTLNGAELVQAETLERFAAAFGPHGFSAETFRPVYGLAEATLAATFSPAGGPSVDWVDRQHLALYGEARPVYERTNGALAVVAVGQPIPAHQLQITDEQGAACAERQVGEIWFRGPSVMRGYFNNPQATQQALTPDGWLRTGDLGYMADGQLHVTGRSKETIIKRGRNYWPQDFEAACIDVPGVRPGRAVAIGLPNYHSGTEDLVLVAEVQRAELVGNPLLQERISRAIDAHTGLRPDRVELIAPGLLPKTTSGKLQRGKVRAAYEAGEVLPGSRRSAAQTVTGRARSAAQIVATRARRLLGWG